MYQAENPYQTWGTLAADATPSARAQFIRLTYLHLAGAVVAFIALEAFLLSLPGIGDIVAQIATARWGWLLVLGAFMGVSYVANAWASSSTSVGMQYLGLGLYVVAEALIFVPLLYLAATFAPPESNVLLMSGVLTLVVFTGLTGIVFLTGADFSFLRSALLLGGVAAMGVIVCAILFGFSLGLVFVGAMLLLSGGYILYDTSNVLHHYQTGQHVAAALALFAAVALMYWYMVQLVLSLSSRD